MNILYAHGLVREWAVDDGVGRAHRSTLPAACASHRQHDGIVGRVRAEGAHVQRPRRRQLVGLGTEFVVQLACQALDLRHQIAQHLHLEHGQGVQRLGEHLFRFVSAEALGKLHGNQGIEQRKVADTVHVHEHLQELAQGVLESTLFQRQHEAGVDVAGQARPPRPVPRILAPNVKARLHYAPRLFIVALSGRHRHTVPIVLSACAGASQRLAQGRTFLAVLVDIMDPPDAERNLLEDALQLLHL